MDNIPTLSKEDRKSRQRFILFKEFGIEDVKKILNEMEQTKENLRKDEGDVTSIKYVMLSGSGDGYGGNDKEQALKIAESGSCTLHATLEMGQPSKSAKEYIYLQISPQHATDQSTENQLYVFGENEKWVKDTYNTLCKVIDEAWSGNRFLYSMWFEMVVQLIAVLLVVAFSLKLANLYGNVVQLPNSQVYAFVVAFLLGSNIWTYVAKVLLGYRNQYFPVVGINVKSRRKTMLAISSFLGLAILSWSINTLFDYFLGKFAK